MEVKDKMSNRLIRNFILLMVLVILLRLPFSLDMFGYGLDDDAWRLVSAATKIAETKSYHYSRLPGYPLVEFFYSLLIQFGPIGINSSTSVIGAVGTGFFYLILEKKKTSNSFLWATLFALTPIIQIYSSTSMDYIWALSFMIIGLYFVYENNPMISGIFLGLAIGSRITYSVFIFVFLGLLWIENKNFMANLKLAISSLIVGGSLYIPIFLQNGLSFLSFYDISTYPKAVRLLGMISVNIWGHLGSAAIIIWFILFCFNFIYKEKIFRCKVSLEEAIWILAILFFIVFWLRLPMTGGYLIPIIPFMFLFISKYSKKEHLWVFAVLIVLSGYIKIKPYQIERGMVIEEAISRKEQVETIDNVYQFFSNLDHKALVYMRSDWTEYMRFQMEGEFSEDLIFEIYPTEEILETYSKNGYKIYYEEKFMANKDIDFNRYNSIPFSISDFQDNKNFP